MTDVAVPPPPTSGAFDTLDAPLPRFTDADAERIAREVFGVGGTASMLVSERDQNFRIATGTGTDVLLKISNAAEDPAAVSMQTQAMLHVARTDPALPVMTPLAATDGARHPTIAGAEGASHIVRLLTFMPGQHLEGPDLDLTAVHAFGAVSARLGRALRGFFHPAAGHALLWSAREAPRLRGPLARVDDPGRRAILARALDAFESRALPVYPLLRSQLIHGDLTLDNAVFDPQHRVTGILDFGDMVHSAVVSDLVATAELVVDRPDPLAALGALCAGFGSVTPLEEMEVEILPELLLARWATSAILAAWRARQYPDCAEYVRGWEAGIWSIFGQVEAMGLERWRVRVRAAATGPWVDEAAADRATPTPVDELVERRRRLFGAAISPLSYDRPLHLVRGAGAWLFDADGHAYLDAYNNVPVVGHCHPEVVRAITAQVRSLNTNVRYLHRSALELAERLIATLSGGLDTVMFVNSGSEANDLAWRLATSFTGGTGGLVTASAYHGATQAVADLTPSEWRGATRPAHIAVLPAPDGYRGRHRSEQADWAERYAAHVDEAVDQLARAGHRPAAMLIDAGFTSDGILRPPPAYLQDAVRRWRAAGGLFVADEVQAGFGRSGAHLWGFQLHGVTPDIVTLGKPMGGGHPVAAVVTRAEIAERFARATEWFSTFGGNPVACEAGLAVLRVIETETLLDNAREMGARLQGRLEALRSSCPEIGEVRAMGLLIGVELVLDRTTRAAATPLAHAVVNRMRDLGVLIGSTGPDANVLKVRPPLVIGEADADRIADTLARALAEVTGGRDPAAAAVPG